MPRSAISAFFLAFVCVLVGLFPEPRVAMCAYGFGVVALVFGATVAIVDVAIGIVQAIHGVTNELRHIGAMSSRVADQVWRIAEHTGPAADLARERLVLMRKG